MVHYGGEWIDTNTILWATSPVEHGPPTTEDISTNMWPHITPNIYITHITLSTNKKKKKRRKKYRFFSPSSLLFYIAEMHLQD